MGGAIAFIVGALLAAIISAIVTYLYLDRGAQSRFRLSQEEANRIVAEAEEQKRASAIEAKDQALSLRSELDRELGQRRKEVDRIERRIEQKEEAIDRKTQSMDAREQNIRRGEQGIERSKEQWGEDRAGSRSGSRCARARLPSPEGNRTGDSRGGRPPVTQDPRNCHSTHCYRLCRRVDRVGRSVAQR